MDTGYMPEFAKSDAPLASFVLRVRGRPAILRYELHNLRTGERRTFVRIETLASFIRQHGLEIDGFAPVSRRAGDSG
jgi:hypothetical protein